MAFQNMLNGLLSTDNIILSAFIVFLLGIIYIKRKNLVIQKILFPIFFISMLRTQLGIKAMNKLANKFRKQLKFLSDFGILIGFLGMILIAVLLVYSIYSVFTDPKAAAGAGIVAPIKAKGVFYVPVIFFIICIFIIAVIHEFSHGVIARVYNLKVKSSGFAFLHILVPIIPMAFVEPDEKELVKRPIREQLGVFAAGAVSNILLAFIVLGLTFGLTYLAAPHIEKYIHAEGVLVSNIVKSENIKYPAETAGMKKGEVIKEIDGFQITSTANFTKALENKKPGDTVNVKTTNGTYTIALAENPDKKGKPYMGIYAAQYTYMDEKTPDITKNVYIPVISWVFELFRWLFILNIGIGLFNLVPLGPIDGGRMLKVVLDKKFRKETSAKLFKWISIFFLVIILANVTIGFIRG